MQDNMNKCIVKGMFFMQDAIMLEQDDLIAEFERKVRDKKIFFEVINPGKNDSKGIDIQSMLEENNKLKSELRVWKDIVQKSITIDARGKRGKDMG
tara:strand:- start:1148 stop:1435 length:288 start_codon:yes stop_codon:yes gene_type:complete